MSKRGWWITFAVAATVLVVAGGVLIGTVIASKAQSTPTPTASAATKKATPTPTPTPTPTFNKALYSIDDPASYWIVVNKHRPLNPLQYEPSDLVEAPVPYAYANIVRQAVADAVVRMFADYTAQTGDQLRLQSVFRDYSIQQSIYDGNDTLTARPGHSEHQTGLAIDISPLSGECATQICFAQTQAGQWLAANAWQYGFVLRYPDGKTDITGYQFEPWHYRYVGPELATEMHNTGVQTLEEFFGLEAAPTYP